MTIQSPIKRVLHNFLELLSKEIKKEENKKYIKENIGSPLMKLIYSEFYPYLITLVVLMCFTICFS